MAPLHDLFLYNEEVHSSSDVYYNVQCIIFKKIKYADTKLTDSTEKNN